MNEQELLILGLLKDGPQHAYFIKKQITKILDRFFALKNQSIYYSLKTLEKEGFLEKKIGRFGNRPDKYIYKLTQNGHRRFEELLNKSFLSVQKPYLDLDLSLYFLPYIEKDVAKRRLRARLVILKKAKLTVENIKKSLGQNPLYHLMAILEHDEEMIDTEINFIQKLINNI